MLETVDVGRQSITCYLPSAPSPTAPISARASAPWRAQESVPTSVFVTSDTLRLLRSGDPVASDLDGTNGESSPPASQSSGPGELIAGPRPP
jgi:hypothetical protein